MGKKKPKPQQKEKQMSKSVNVTGGIRFTGLLTIVFVVFKLLGKIDYRNLERGKCPLN